MPDEKRISELDPAILPLAGTELFAIVQGGDTRKIQASLLASELIRLGGGGGTQTLLPARLTNTNAFYAAVVAGAAPPEVSSGLLYTFSTDYAGVA